MRTLLGPGSTSVPSTPPDLHDWMRSPRDDRSAREDRIRPFLAYRCRRCRAVYRLVEGVLPQPGDRVEVGGVAYGSCEEAGVALVLES